MVERLVDLGGPMKHLLSFFVHYHLLRVDLQDVVDHIDVWVVNYLEVVCFFDLFQGLFGGLPDEVLAHFDLLEFFRAL